MNYYLIYDGEDNNLFAEDVIRQGKTAKEAILLYLKETGRDYKIRRFKDNRAKFKATKFTYRKDGVKVRSGNDVWYGIDY